MFNAIPAFGIFGSVLAQKIVDSGETVGDINAPDPELLPRQEKFKDLKISTDGLPDYRYAPLESPSSIRLLELWGIRPPTQDPMLSDRVGYTIIHSDQSHQSIWCRIVHRDPTAEYETISYTWAGLPKSIPIFVDGGRVIWVNAPIYACLQRLEIGSTPRYLWIDQICIDQDNIKERNIQVLLMKTIFESAQKTLIWLGEEDEDTPLALECINKIPTLARAPMESREVPGSSLAIVQDMLSQGIREPESPAYRKRVAMGRLLNRGWFERAWVYQEAAVSSHVTVQIGPHEIDFVHFCTAVRVFCDVEREKWRTFGRSLPIATRGYNTLEVVEYGRRYLVERNRSTENGKDPRSIQKRNASFVALMFRLAGLVQATDPCDLVYSFLGFQDLLKKPDYALSLSQVYTNTARSFVEMTESLDVFGITSITGRPAGLPSWAPDWTQRSPQGAPLYRPDIPSSFRACKTFIHERIPSGDDSRYLVVKGKVIDTVALVSNHDFDQNNRNKGALDGFLKLRQQLDFFKEAQAPPVVSEAKHGISTYAIPVSGSTPPRRPFADMFEDEAHQKKRLIKTILADNAYKFNPANEKQTGQVPISASELEDYLAAYANEDAIRQGSIFLPRLGHLSGMRDEFRGNMLVSVKRRLFHGEHSHLGLAPQAVKMGDLVCILHGSRVPCLLRKAGAVNRYELVGQCYYEDWMYGDPVNWVEEDADSFELQ
jgi:Heterokaryon incompatibility protein (HET)